VSARQGNNLQQADSLDLAKRRIQNIEAKAFEAF
jgi:hypothetical protein